ncbi:MAG: hypothetical protein IPO60_12980 [Flavobacteriales bacterium]|jgi:hypothetical protein|nr:hypothetical protein [Flavobacteriales bacterium]MBK9599198.1 hypothetical protein [Flavobacteriales bacterium]QQS72484.1 MAG: hypothetical protein IPP95_15150 [Flavobacteriales bacterium]HQV39457.1 hypothetical protein [Flavobacteriales bacterium]HQW33407.1 hypothetical protein [Flavobacteriales bacterium]
MRTRVSRDLLTVVPLLVAFQFVVPGPGAFGQCTNNNTLLGSAITPPCPGTTTVPCITGGQYALVNVTLGNIYSFSTCGAAWDTQITIFNNTGGGSLGYNDDSGACPALGPSYLGWTATFTGQLRVLVDAYPCASNSLCATLTITCATVPAAVTNNECAGAITLNVNDVCTMQTYSNAGATRSTTTPNPTCGGTFTNGNFKDVWFKFTAPANGVVIIETAPGTLTDSRMALLKGTCGSYTNVDCDDDGGVGYMSKIDRRCNPLVPGANYFIRVWGYAGATGSFGICIRSFTSFPTPQEDCVGGNTVCSSDPITNQVDYVGCSNDLTGSNRGCLMGNERQGSWYFFTPSVAGTASLTISPIGGNVDYDFAIWERDALQCPPVGAPTRCSWAYPPNVPLYPAPSSFQTGMRPASFDLSESDVGDGFVAPLPLVMGKIYIMYIDNFDVTGQSFNLTWSFTGGASLDCTTLPVELIDLQAIAHNTVIDVTWATATEKNSDHFTVERSPDNETFAPIGTVAAAGDAQGRNDYSFADTDPFIGANYYRLKQVDYNGAFEYTRTVVAFMGQTGTRPVIFPNPATDRLNVAFTATMDGPALIHVQDALGRTVAETSVQTARGEQTTVIPIEKLARGWYGLSIALPDGSVLPSGGFLKR